MGERSRDSTGRTEQDVLRELLRRERKRRGITAKALSLTLGHHHSYISRIERSSRTVDVVEFLDIAKALGIDPKELFAGFVDLTKR